MENRPLAQITRLRLLVGFLGEQSQFNWWPSSFFTANSSSPFAHFFRSFENFNILYFRQLKDSPIFGES
jgi:hypothetical protein